MMKNHSSLHPCLSQPPTAELAALQKYVHQFKTKKKPTVNQPVTAALAPKGQPCGWKSRVTAKSHPLTGEPWRPPLVSSWPKHPQPWVLWEGAPPALKLQAPPHKLKKMQVLKQQQILSPLQKVTLPLPAANGTQHGSQALLLL